MYQVQVYELGNKWMYWVYVQVYTLGIGTRYRYKYDVLSIAQQVDEKVQVRGVRISIKYYVLGIGV